MAYIKGNNPTIFVAQPSVTAMSVMAIHLMGREKYKTQIVLDSGPSMFYSFCSITEVVDAERNKQQTPYS